MLECCAIYFATRQTDDDKCGADVSQTPIINPNLQGLKINFERAKNNPHSVTL